MIRIGITGGIGMGKSAAGEILKARGIPVTDTDEVARALVAPGQPALGEIRAAFGAGVFREDGSLDRARLGAVVFADASARQRLEGILHPRIREEWMAHLERWRGEGRPAGAVSIPLLFETSAEGRFDAVICVACSAATQRERLRLRGWEEAHCRQRISAQWPVSRKMDASRYVIWTDVPMAVHAEQWDRVLRLLGV